MKFLLEKPYNKYLVILPLIYGAYVYIGRWDIGIALTSAALSFPFAVLVLLFAKKINNMPPLYKKNLSAWDQEQRDAQRAKVRTNKYKLMRSVKFVLPWVILLLWAHFGRGGVPFFKEFVTLVAISLFIIWYDPAKDWLEKLLYGEAESHE